MIKLINFFLIRTLLFVFGSPIVMNVAFWPKPYSLLCEPAVAQHHDGTPAADWKAQRQCRFQ